MPCYYPIDGWRAKEPNESGKYPVVFTRSAAQQDQEMRIPCGRCIGCRLERSRQWAMRCVHESTLYTENCFITLTYNEENLPYNQSLDKTHWQRFMKRLRKHIGSKRIRFFACGEYGAGNQLNKLGRPHYHAILFNYDFADKQPQFQNDQGDMIYSSELLDRIWGKGMTTTGDLTFDSAAYVARYCMKKINGEEAEEHYNAVHPQTGEHLVLEPEFATQSRKPGVGADWFHRYKNDLNKGFLTMRGIKMQPPKYYKDLYSKFDEERFMFIKQKAIDAFDPGHPDLQLDRLRVREEVKKRKIKTLERNL